VRPVHRLKMTSGRGCRAGEVRPRLIRVDSCRGRPCRLENFEPTRPRRGEIVDYRVPLLSGVPANVNGKQESARHHRI
jgi:hypothetical protein